MMLRIQKYDVEIKYVPGKDIPVADALSRVSPCPGDTIDGLDVSVHGLHLHLNATPTRINQIRERKQLRMKFFSHYAQSSHKAGLIQDENVHRTYMCIGITAMN